MVQLSTWSAGRPPPYLQAVVAAAQAQEGTGGPRVLVVDVVPGQPLPSRRTRTGWRVVAVCRAVPGPRDRARLEAWPAQAVWLGDLSIASLLAAAYGSGPRPRHAPTGGFIIHVG